MLNYKHKTDVLKVGTNMNYKNPSVFSSIMTSKYSKSVVAMALVLGTVSPAYADITNEVTVTGTPPGGTPTQMATADETVDVENANPVLLTTKTAVITDSNGDPVTGSVSEGDTITYTFTALNDGNQTLTAVSMADPHDVNANGTLSALVFAATPLDDQSTAGDSTDSGSDNVWDVLAPDDTVTWTATYVITQQDIIDQMGDGSVDNIATATGTPPNLPNGDPAPPTTDDSPPVSVTLDAANPSLFVTKEADDKTDVVVGQTITYTYTITNNGNVPISNVSATDSVTAGTGANPTPGNETLLTDNNAIGDSDTGTAGDGIWATLGVGDVITMTGTYIVTQADVDNLQ